MVGGGECFRAGQLGETAVGEVKGAAEAGSMVKVVTGRNSREVRVHVHHRAMSVCRMSVCLPVNHKCVEDRYTA